MNLQEFVQDSLKQIMAGVSEAGKDDTRIAPRMHVDEKDAMTLRTTAYRPVFLIEFDVAVTVADTSATGGKAGITVLSVATLGGEKSKTTETTSVSRIKFSVPVSFRD
jgi:hypothetical protein